MTEQETRNEGEGSRTAAEAYNQKTREFLKRADVDKAAHEAATALNSSEGEELRRAEEQGRAHAKEEDPQVRRDR